MQRILAVVVVGALMSLAATQAASAAVASHLSIGFNHQTEHFHGRVSSSDAECTAGRTVKLFKKTSNGRVLQGKVTSSPDGTWKIEVMHVHGKYFAVAPAQKVMHTACGRARSRTIDVM